MPVQSRRSNKYIRIVCPTDLRPRLGLREVVRSLGTSSHREALIRSYPVELAIRLAFDEARRDPMVDRAKLQELIDKLTDAAVERLSGQLSIGPQRPVTVDAEKAWASAIDRRARKSSNHAPATGTGQRLSEAVADFCAEKVRQKAWTEQTEEMYRGVYAELVQILGDPLAASVTKQDLLNYQQALSKLPVAAAKRWPGLDARQVIEQAEGLDVPRLSAKSQNKRIAATKSLFAHLTLTDCIGRDPSVVLKPVNAERRPEDERSPLTDSEVLAFLAKCEADATEAAHRWLPRICAYSGLRLDEAGQLDRDDIVEEEGISCLRVKAGGGRKLKTKNAARLVPIHSSMLDELLAYREGRPQGNLWGLQKGRRGHTANVGNWLGRRLDTVVNDRQKTFHSLRHSTSDKLKRGGLQDYVIAAVLGHANASISTGRYGSRVPPSVLRDAVEKIAYEAAEAGEGE